MSLGWQTESALMPRAAKPINVHEKSIAPLKSFVTNIEVQQEKIEKPALPSTKEIIDAKRKRKLEKKRKLKANQVYEVPEEDKVYDALKAKTKLYEDMKAGKSNSSVNRDINKRKEESNLIDFQRKEQLLLTLKTKNYNDEDLTPSIINNDDPVKNDEMTNDYNEDDYEIDEFGRSKLKLKNNAKVKSQWERLLQGKAKDYLNELNKETNRKRQLMKEKSDDNLNQNLNKKTKKDIIKYNFN